jgi:hypothetical protein
LQSFYSVQTSFKYCANENIKKKVCCSHYHIIYASFHFVYAEKKNRFSTVLAFFWFSTQFQCSHFQSQNISILVEICFRRGKFCRFEDKSFPFSQEGRESRENKSKSRNQMIGKRKRKTAKKNSNENQLEKV